MAHRTPPDVDEPTIGRLVAETTQDFSQLLRSEIELAKTELKVSVRFGALGVALFAVAGFLAVLAIIMGSFAAAYGIDTIDGIGTWLAFLIVFGIYLLIAAVLGLIGVRKVKKVRPPEKTIAAVKSNKQIVKRS
jgi:hypothetical protein